MIDPKIEYIYDIILSLFIGIIIAIVFSQLFENPIVLIVYKKNPKQSVNKMMI